MEICLFPKRIYIIGENGFKNCTKQHIVYTSISCKAGNISVCPVIGIDCPCVLDLVLDLVYDLVLDLFLDLALC